ncbi:hypothetical protein [Acinetobacter rudis]|uniref:Lipoprotein n=1 Tax=Acinetobacter rudis CIP 110305 TaxID=421052 RepID=S3N9Q7_9GAMM|nr:hypothetical protein [Acinetobacter rudis]EPF71084.1 hypothetical protein F945_02847 [Acinetobacter rudis CIP 110305]
MNKLSYLILALGISSILSACNKEPVVNPSLNGNEMIQQDYSHLPPEQFRGELKFFKEQLDIIFNTYKFVLRDEGIAYAPTQGFLVIQIPMKELDIKVYHSDIFPKIKESGWVFKKSIKNADIFCHGNQRQLEIIRPKDYSREIVGENDKLAFSALETEWNIGMYYQEQGTFFCGQSLPIINIE